MTKKRRGELKILVTFVLFQGTEIEIEIKKIKAMAALEKQKKADISRVIESAESRGGSREQYSISNRMVFYYTLMIIELNYESRLN